MNQKPRGDRLHRRQFVIGPEPLLVDENWRSIQIGPSRHLSHCRTLPVVTGRSKDDGALYLLGNAVQTDRTKLSPIEQLSGAQEDALPGLYRDWCGRWVLVTQQSVHPDACALLGCYYRVLQGPGAVESWVSSSAALLHALPDREQPPELGSRLTHARGMDWYPPPRSRYGGIHRLLPTQTLEFPDEGPAVLVRRRLMTDDVAGAAYDDLLGFLEARLVGGMAAMAKQGGPFWLPLTAGYDSRLLLSLAARVDAPLITYSFEKPSNLISRADRTLPPQLAANTDSEHRVIPRREFSETRALAFDAHTAGHTVDIDREYLARGQWDQIPSEAVILRGGVFEVGRAYYHGKLPFDELGDLDQAYDRIAGAFGFESLHAGSAAHSEGLREWISWCNREPEPGIDWRDRFYLEQRVAGWLAPIEQALDLTAPERVHLANAAATITALVALPLETRRRTEHHVDLIRRSTPQLVKYPFNPPDSVRQMAISKARGAVRKLTRIGCRLGRIRTAT